MLIWKKEPVPVFQRVSSLLRHYLKRSSLAYVRVRLFSLFTTTFCVFCASPFVVVVVVLLHQKPLSVYEEEMSSLFVSSYKNRRKTHHQIMGGKTELTTIKTLMEITGQNKEDVQSVLQKFGGDEALAVSELMCSACNHHLSRILIFHAPLAGKSSVAKRCVVALREQRLTLYDFSFLNYSA